MGDGGWGGGGELSRRYLCQPRGQITLRIVSSLLFFCGLRRRGSRSRQTQRRESGVLVRIHADSSRTRGGDSGAFVTAHDDVNPRTTFFFTRRQERRMLTIARSSIFFYYFHFPNSISFLLLPPVFSVFSRAFYRLVHWPEDLLVAWFLSQMTLPLGEMSR